MFMTHTCDSIYFSIIILFGVTTVNTNANVCALMWYSMHKINFLDDACDRNILNSEYKLNHFTYGIVNNYKVDTHITHRSTIIRVCYNSQTKLFQPLLS